MSASLMEMYATIQALLAANVVLVKITTPILVIIGDVGELLNVLVFVQANFRNNSCAIYFLAAACIRLVFINYTILFNGLSIGKRCHTNYCSSSFPWDLGYNVHSAQTSLAVCKMKLYLTTLTAILPPSFMVLACIDRFASSSMNARVRSWSRPYVAYRMIAVVTLFWVIFSIHPLIGAIIYQSPGQSYCYIQDGVYAIFVAFYSVICNYLLPPILMAVFGLLTIINIRRTRRRVQTAPGLAPMAQKDRYLFQMLIFQVLVNIIFTIPAGVYQVHLNWCFFSV